MSTVTLVTGGARSGKSSYALELCSQSDKKAFIATATAFDSEMHERIEKHQQDRGNAFITVEEPLDLASAIRSLDNVDIAIIDCLTVWLCNLMNKYGADKASIPEIEEFLDAIKNPPCDLVIVTNELGSGIVPENELARHFRDLAGRLNQDVATLANKAVLTVSGMPVILKDEDE
jgi:adenosylcobinamide kinase/adenosylcobinamide-phosphate guanylyltransferase